MPVRTTAILNLKGGVAKTTTAINLATILALQHNKRVLVIDADSQCNITEFFGADLDSTEEPWHPLTSGTLAGILRGAELYDDPGSFAASYIRSTRYEGVNIIAGDDTLMDMDLSKVEQGTVNSNVLRYLVELVKDEYDFILIDCPPAFNAASAAALIAADDVIIPIKLDAFSLRGMDNLMRQIKNMRRINPRLKIAGLLPTMWYQDPQIEDSEKQLKDAGFYVFHHIRSSRPVDKMTFQQEPLSICSPRSAAGIDYRTFVREYLEVN